MITHHGAVLHHEIRREVHTSIIKMENSDEK